MKHWTWKTWLTLGIVVVLGVVALVLVIVGVVTHEEPGFTNPENRWDHVPLSVSCAGYVPADDEACETVEDVVSTINRRLGFVMLDYVPTPVVVEGQETAEIHVRMRTPVEVGDDGPCGAPGECFELTGSDGVYDECQVRTMNASGPNDLEWLVVYHGIGHCLGLAHDDFEISIMRPVQRPTPDRTLPPWITDFDRSILRERYAP